ncbi:unnamed protein product [Gordionus sp. m RMFG-2023]
MYILPLIIVSDRQSLKRPFFLQNSIQNDDIFKGERPLSLDVYAGSNLVVVPNKLKKNRFPNPLEIRSSKIMKTENISLNFSDSSFIFLTNDKKKHASRLHKRTTSIDRFSDPDFNFFDERNFPESWFKPITRLPSYRKRKYKKRPTHKYFNANRGAKKNIHNMPAKISKNINYSPLTPNLYQPYDVIRKNDLSFDSGNFKYNPDFDLNKNDIKILKTHPYKLRISGESAINILDRFIENEHKQNLMENHGNLMTTNINARTQPESKQNQIYNLEAHDSYINTPEPIYYSANQFNAYQSQEMNANSYFSKPFNYYSNPYINQHQQEYHPQYNTYDNLGKSDNYNENIASQITQGPLQNIQMPPYIGYDKNQINITEEAYYTNDMPKAVNENDISYNLQTQDYIFPYIMSSDEFSRYLPQTNEIIEIPLTLKDGFMSSNLKPITNHNYKGQSLNLPKLYPNNSILEDEIDMNTIELNNTNDNNIKNYYQFRDNSIKSILDHRRSSLKPDKIILSTLPHKIAKTNYDKRIKSSDRFTNIKPGYERQDYKHVNYTPLFNKKLFKNKNWIRIFK